MAARDLSQPTVRDSVDTTERDLQTFSGKTLSDVDTRVNRAVGHQSFPWSFPLWFSDVTPRDLTS